MSKSLISADGSSRASPPWKVCFRRKRGDDFLCDTVLYCILLLMRCVWFCVFLLDLGSQALVYASVSSCVHTNWEELLSVSFVLEVSLVCSKYLLCDELMWLSR
ncbi:unnamed protein product [Arctogadus glacialis]